MAEENKPESEPEKSVADRLERLAAEAVQGRQREEVHPALDRSPERQQEERNAAKKWLGEKWPQERRACPICGVRDWIIGDTSQLHLYGALGSVYPLVPVVCKNCAHTYLFQAIQMGVVSEKDPPED